MNSRWIRASVLLLALTLGLAACGTTDLHPVASPPETRMVTKSRAPKPKRISEEEAKSDREWDDLMAKGFESHKDLQKRVRREEEAREQELRRRIQEGHEEWLAKEMARREAYVKEAKPSEDLKAAILAGRVTSGRTTDEVRASIGNPARKTTTTTADTTTVTWFYGSTGNPRVIIGFINGRVYMVTYNE